MDSNFMIRLIVALSLLVIAGHFIGSTVNRRRRKSLALWIKPAVDALGGRILVRWLGTSGLHIDVQNLSSPRKALSLFLSLEPRELFLFWIFSRLRGKRDCLILKADLAKSPQAAFDLWRRGARTSPSPRGERLERGEFTVSIPEGSARGPAEAVTCLIESAEARWERLSVRPSSPHLSALLPVSVPPSYRAEEIFETLDRTAALLIESDTPAGRGRRGIPQGR